MTMGKLVEPGTTGNSDVGENPIYDVTCGAPSEFTEAELARYIAIIQAEDAVDPGSTARDLPRAKVIAVARKDSEIVGVGTIKRIRVDYARGIAGPKKSGWRFDPRVPELGYVAVDSQHRLWFVKTSRTDKNFSSAWCVSLLIRDSLLQPEVTPIHGLGPRRKARQPDSDWGDESRSRLIEWSESMPLRRNDDAVPRVEKGSESCFPPEDTSLLADPSACPSRVRGASDLHGNSEHTQPSAA